MSAPSKIARLPSWAHNPKIAYVRFQSAVTELNEVKAAFRELMFEYKTQVDVNKMERKAMLRMAHKNHCLKSKVETLAAKVLVDRQAKSEMEETYEDVPPDQGSVDE